MSAALNGHRLCERSAGLLEERALDSWRAPGAVDQSEWVTQIRTLSTVVGPYFVQESLHPNHWGQLALRSCLRQAVSGPTGSCRVAGAGLTAAGEPRMTLQ